MNQPDVSTNNSSEQSLVIDEVASIKQHLQGYPQRKEILQNIQEYQARIFKRERDKKLLGS